MQMSDASTQSQPCAVKSKWLVRRLYPSTWLAILLASGVMFLIEAPGRRTGQTTYAHGWPFVYAERDYRVDPQLEPDLAPHLRTPAADAEAEDWMSSHNHSLNGIPWETERKLTPWSIANLLEVRTLALVADFVLALAVVCLSAWLFQHWRRRRRLSLFRFRLRTMLIGVAVLCLLFGKAAAWRDAYETDQTIRNEFSTAPDGQKQEGYFDVAWRPPRWLPEAILKMGDLGQFFNRVCAVRTDDWTPRRIELLSEAPQLISLTIGPAAITPQLRDRLSILSQLEFVELGAGTSDSDLIALANLKSLRSLILAGADHVTDAGMRAIADQFPQLNWLVLTSNEFSDKGLAELGRLPELKGLVLDCPNISADGLRRLAAAPQLNYVNLTLGRHAKLRSTDGFNGFHHLRRLDLKGDGVESIVLYGLPDLQRIEVDKCQSLTHVELRSLPHLTTARIAPTLGLDTIGEETPDEPSFDARLCDLPRLNELVLAQAKATTTLIDDIRSLPALKSFWLSLSQKTPQARLAVSGCRELEELFIRPNATDLQLSDLRSLRAIGVAGGKRLKSIALHNLPALEMLSISVAQAPSVEFDQSPAVRALEIDDQVVYSAVPGFVDAVPPPNRDNSHLRGVLRVEGLAQLRQLETVVWRKMRIEPDLFDSLRHLSGLRRIDMAGSSLDDDGLRRLTPMPLVEHLELSNTQVTDAARESLASMPNLKSLDLTNTVIANSTITVLQTALPNAEVIADDRAAPISEKTSFPSDVRYRIERSVPDGGAVAPDVGNAAKEHSVLAALDFSAAKHVTNDTLKHVAQISDLAELDLSNTWVTDAGLVELARLKRLESLLCQSTAVNGAGFTALTGLRNLTAVDLTDAELVPGGLSGLAALPNLCSLYLGGPNLTDELLPDLAGCSRLESLYLRAPNISPGGLAKLPSLPKLRHVKLDTLNVAGGRIDLAALRNQPSLHSLDLAGAAVEPADLRRLSQLTTLRTLNLNNSIVGIATDTLKGLENCPPLETLSLSQTNFWTDGLVEIGKLRELTELDLSVSSGVTDDTLESLMGLKKLKKLDLRFCHVSGEGVKRLAKLPALEILVVPPDIPAAARAEAAAINPRLKVVDEIDAITDFLDSDAK